MPRPAVLVSTAALLAGPTVLAFFAGGYFDGPRAIAAAVAWAVVLLLAAAGPLPLPASRPGRLALGALLGLIAWSAISLAWAPLLGPALDAVVRLLLYTGALLAAIAVLRDPRAARAAEPVLALGALIVIGYGLSGRLLPSVIDLITERSYAAAGRLEQPITYWNSEGLVAALGLLLSVRLAGDRSRPAWMRVAAAAACAPLGAGVYLSYSRGAVAVTMLGLIVLIAAAPTWPQLRAAATGLVAGLTAAACSSAFPGVASLHGTAAAQRRDGAIMLVFLLLIMGVATLLTLRAVAAERDGTTRIGWLPNARRLPAVAIAAAALCVAGLIGGGLAGGAESPESVGKTASRYASVSSVRYEYWRVGALAFTREPVRGLGAGGFRVFWREERRVPYSVTEVHSLPLEMAAELGLPGLLMFLLLVGAVGIGGLQALRQGAPLAPGAVAVCIAWLVHAAVDWDWQLPAVTLPAVILAGGLLAASEGRVPVAPDAWLAEESRREAVPVSAG